MPSSRRRKRFTFGVLFTIIALLVMAEIVLRMFWGFGTPLLYRSDPAAGYVVAPAQHIVRFGHPNHINQFSMRSPDMTPAKPSGELRILFLGDSVTYGTTFVDQDRIFTSLLAQRLPGLLHRPVEVLNASAGGWAIGNELGYLRSRGTFAADLVVFVINTGDLTQPFAPSTVDISPGFPSHNPPFALAELIERYLLPRITHQNTADPGSTSSKVDISDHTPPNLAELGQAKDFAADHHAQFMIVFSPFIGHDWTPYAPGKTMLEDWCQTHSVRLVDLTAHFPPHELHQIYFSGNVHLREKGDAIAADVIAPEILSLLSSHPASQPSHPNP